MPRGWLKAKRANDFNDTSRYFGQTRWSTRNAHHKQSWVGSHISPHCGHLSYLRRGLFICISGQARQSTRNAHHKQSWVGAHISPPCGHLSYLRRGLFIYISGQTCQSAQNILYILNFTLYTLNIEQASESQTCLNFCNERSRYSTKLNH